jgi:hypothetical protein
MIGEGFVEDGVVDWKLAARFDPGDLNSFWRWACLERPGEIDLHVPEVTELLAPAGPPNIVIPCCTEA